MLDKLNLIKELKEDFGFDSFQIVDLLNGAHFKDIVLFDKSLINLYNEYCKGAYDWYEYTPIDELNNFLDTLKGSLAFKLCEEADDISKGIREYFIYDESVRQLRFCSLDTIVQDMNDDIDFRNYLNNIGYFDETKTKLGKVLDKYFSKVEV